MKQVDILISKNQALQILKLHELPWIETYENIIPTKLNNDTIQFYCYNTIVSKTYLTIGHQVLTLSFFHIRYLIGICY